jgi:hypothetical protein
MYFEPFFHFDQFEIKKKMKKKTLCQQKFDRTKFGTETDNLGYSCSVSVSVLSQKFQICPVSVSVPRGGTETGQDRDRTETGQIMVGQENTDGCAT